MRAKKAAVATKQEATAKVELVAIQRLWATIPKGGVEIKLLTAKAKNPNHVLGTLLVTETGLKWAKPNAKIKPEREITFAVLDRLHKAGLI